MGAKCPALQKSKWNNFIHSKWWRKKYNSTGLEFGTELNMAKLLHSNSNINYYRAIHSKTPWSMQLSPKTPRLLRWVFIRNYVQDLWHYIYKFKLILGSLQDLIYFVFTTVIHALITGPAGLLPWPQSILLLCCQPVPVLRPATPWCYTGAGLETLHHRLSHALPHPGDIAKVT